MPTRVALLTFSATDFDSRIHRMTAALAGAGYEPVLVSPDEAPVIAGLAAHFRVPAVGKTAAQVLAHLALALPATVVSAAALPLHHLLPSCRRAVKALVMVQPAIIHANDWVTLPAALEAARRVGASVVYDSHEFATEEHADRLWWRFGMQRNIRVLEAALIGEAAHVVTIGPGLADALRRLYGERINALTIVRNLPDLPAQVTARTPDGQIRLAYAGLIRPDRRIDVMIAALARLDSRFRLQITGFGPPSHVAMLKSLAAAQGVGGRVDWHPAVPPSELVAHLGKADIGLFLSDGEHGQQRFALPNKIFEYTAAGLAIVSSGSGDVEALLARHGQGACLNSADPDALAALLLEISAVKLGTMKAKARHAALELNWGRESRELISVYEKLRAGIRAG
jgi:glycogen synthase